MEYKYLPLYKYLTFALITFLFLKYENLIDQYLLFQITAVLTFIFIILDMILIKDHPQIIDINDDDDDDDELTPKELEKEVNELPVVDDSVEIDDAE